MPFVASVSVLNNPVRVFNSTNHWSYNQSSALQHPRKELAMKLKRLLTLHADLKTPVEIGTGPCGARMVFNVSGGTFEGPRLRGTVVPGGGDWLVIDGEGVGRLDVRIILKTDDGARIYVQYYGVI